MPTTPIARTVAGASLVLAPVLNLVSAACAAAALKPDSRTEIAAIAAHPGQFYVYAITQLIGAYLLIPAFAGLRDVLRERRPRWADLAGGAILISMLVAIGDAAVELVYWQMGAAGANLDQMVALSDRYENAAGASLPYAIGGMSLLVSTVVFAIGLWRSRAVPVWAALTIPVSIFANIFGYASGSQLLLLASAVVMLAGFGRMAPIVMRRRAGATAPVAQTPITATA
jgi:hypothetical protein